MQDSAPAQEIPDYFTGTMASYNSRDLNLSISVQDLGLHV